MTANHRRWIERFIHLLDHGILQLVSSHVNDTALGRPTYISLFSGVGGFDLGFDEAGWECVGQVEWDKNCQAVLNHHWPDVPKWWDVSEVSGYDLPEADAIIFGSPCQDLSIEIGRAHV